MKEFRNYRDLLVWQKAVGLSIFVYQLTQIFPKEETNGLTSQIRRAAVSIASNISEGHARGSRSEFLHYLNISKGSLAELETQTTIASKLKYISGDEEGNILTQTEQIGRMISGLRKALKTKKINETSGVV